MGKEILTEKVFKVLSVLAFLFVVFLLFYKLEECPLYQTDEAFHGCNAYEMKKSGNFLINTYKYELDYFNSKPPLALLFIIISMILFGNSYFALRCSSALFAVAILVVFLRQLRKNHSFFDLFFCELFFISSESLFTFHMFRSGDFDSLYGLCFSVCMLSLMEYIDSGNKKNAIVFGLFLGLAFLSKGMHVATIVVILIISILFNRNRMKYVMWMFLSAVIPILFWAIPRFMYDGLEFFLAGFVGEAEKQTSSFSFSNFIVVFKYLYSQWLFKTLFFLVILFLLNSCFRKNELNVLKIVKKNIVLLCWIIIPMVFYPATGATLEWYFYPSYLGSIYACTIIFSLIRKKVEKPIIFNSICIVCVMICLFSSYTIIEKLVSNSEGYSPTTAFKKQLINLNSNYSDTYVGYNAYIENSYNSFSEDDYWECDYTLCAEMYEDWICLSGGAQEFESSIIEKRILVVHRDLEEKYNNIIAKNKTLSKGEYIIVSAE